MASFVSLLIGTVVLVKIIDSSNILVVYPTPSKSNLLIGEVLFEALAERGHNLTIFSNFQLKKSVRNYRVVYIPITEEVSGKFIFFFNQELFLIISF